MYHTTQLDIGKTKYLKSIRVGTLTVTTVDNREFGIKAGRVVTLHVVIVGSSLSIGGLVGSSLRILSLACVSFSYIIFSVCVYVCVCVCVCVCAHTTFD